MEPTDTIGDDIRLYNADCLAVLPTLAAGSVDCVVTDPPYGIDLRNGDVDGHRSDRWDKIPGDKSPDIGLFVIEWSERHDLPLVIFASPWEPWPVSSRNLIVWDKGGAVGGGGDIATCLKRSWELIQTCRTGLMNGGRDESVWRFPITPKDTEEHIAAKPVPLMRALIRRFTAAGNTILDPTMGSGTTGVAAIREGRRFIGIELDPGHYATALRRLRHAAGKSPDQLFSVLGEGE